MPVRCCRPLKSKYSSHSIWRGAAGLAPLERNQRNAGTAAGLGVGGGEEGRAVIKRRSVNRLAVDGPLSRLSKLARCHIGTDRELAPGSPTEGYAHCLAPATDVRQLKLFLKTRQWFVVKEQRAAPDLEAVPAAVLKCLGNVEIAGEQSALLASLP